MTTKTNVKLEETILQLAFRWLLPRFCCGRDGRASKIARRPIEQTRIILPILAALPFGKTNRLIKSTCNESNPLLTTTRTPFLCHGHKYSNISSGRPLTFPNSGGLQTTISNLMKMAESFPYEQFLIFPQCFQKTCSEET